MFDKVEKAFVNANKTMIAKALNSAVEVRSIDNQVHTTFQKDNKYFVLWNVLFFNAQVDDWRTESFMDLGWLESLGRLVDIMSIGKYFALKNRTISCSVLLHPVWPYDLEIFFLLDAKTTSNGAMKLLKAMDVDTTTTDSIDAFLTIMAEGTIDEVLNG